MYLHRVSTYSRFLKSALRLVLSRFFCIIWIFWHPFGVNACFGVNRKLRLVVAENYFLLFLYVLDVEEALEVFRVKHQTNPTRSYLSWKYLQLPFTWHFARPCTFVVAKITFIREVHVFDFSSHLNSYPSIDEFLKN